MGGPKHRGQVVVGNTEKEILSQLKVKLILLFPIVL
jgi:hypothetical protein